MLGSLTRLAVAAFLAQATGFSAPARAAVIVDGSGDSMRVEARDSSIAEVLEALGATFDPRLRKTANLDKPVSKTFEGSTSQILSSLLDGYDYVATISASGKIEFAWISRSSNSSGAPAFLSMPSITRANPPSANANADAAPDPKQVVMSPRIRAQMVERAERLRKARALRPR